MPSSASSKSAEGKGDDEIDAGSGNDRVAGGGSDRLLGSSGNDFRCGGIGNDFLFGQGGNDWLLGEAADDVLIPGAGNDILFGASGRDLLIGGSGEHFHFSEIHDDILISGSTIHDEDLRALSALQAEWESSASYATRVASLRTGGGINEDFTLDESSIIDDGAADFRFGQAGQGRLAAESFIELAMTGIAAIGQRSANQQQWQAQGGTAKQAVRGRLAAALLCCGGMAAASQ